MVAYFLKQQIKLNCAGKVGNRLVYGEGLALDLAKRWTHSTMLIEHQHCLLGNSNQAARRTQNPKKFHVKHITFYNKAAKGK